MSRTPRTEDAWRDATMAPKNQQMGGVSWHKVAHDMYEFAQTLERREENERWSALVDSLRDDLEAARMDAAEMQRIVDGLRGEVAVLRKDLLK